MSLGALAMEAMEEEEQGLPVSAMAIETMEEKKQGLVDSVTYNVLLTIN